MPAYRILYTSARTDHAITEAVELITEAHWSAERTQRHFRQTHPGAAVIQCREIVELPSTARC